MYLDIGDQMEMNKTTPGFAFKVFAFLHDELGQVEEGVARYNLVLAEVSFTLSNDITLLNSK